MNLKLILFDYSKTWYLKLLGQRYFTKILSHIRYLLSYNFKQSAHHFQYFNLTYDLQYAQHVEINPHLTEMLNSIILSAVWREDQHLGRLVPGTNSDGDRADELDLQSVHPDLQKVRGMVFPVPRHPGERRRAQAAHHPQADRARVPVRLPDRQGWVQDQGDPRGDRRLDPGRLRHAA